MRGPVLGVVVALGAAVALAGCAGSSPAVAPSPTAGPVSTLDCAGTAVPASALDDRRPGTEVDGILGAAVDDARAPLTDLGDLAEWFVAEESTDRLTVLRALDAPDDLGAGDVRTHRVLTVERGLDPSLPDTAWMLTRSGTCALVVALDGAGTASVTLDAGRAGDPASTTLRLLVTERACNSGADAEGRVRLVRLVETTTTVEVVLAVDPRGGGQTCPSNPPTPYGVDLAVPLGDRIVLDASVVPAREVTSP